MLKTIRQNHGGDDGIDRIGLLDDGDDSHPTAAFRTGQNIDLEHALEHRSAHAMLFGRLGAVGLPVRVGLEGRGTMWERRG